MDLLKITVAIACGIGFASLFTWGNGTDVASISASGILVHNASLALLALFLTHYGATVMMVLNGFWLGMGLVASVAAVGLPQTLALTVVHIPLEVIAWGLTIQGARLVWPLILGSGRKRHSWRHAARHLKGVLAAPLVFYILAALAEWAEHALLER
ncbi:hypothetical protein ACLRGI_09625 [Paenarthrobacter nitroguajacolicus]|uniref:hypothetical protein n=1 Tax=Paenarthrobacter nitroguajacolicus TaxID=211146 RepID=UPI003AED8F40